MPEFQAHKKAARLDRFLREQVFAGAEWLSRQAWDFLIENGFVAVDGRKCVKSGAELAEGARVALSFPGGALGLLKADRPAALVARLPGLAVFLKPAGVDSVPLFPWQADCFANQVCAALEAEGVLPAASFAALAAPPRLEGGLLQRLDRDTSGLLLCALDAPTKELFRGLLSRAALEKTYEALVSGQVGQLAGEHRFWLETKGGAKVRAFAKPPRGEAEECVLRVKVLKSKGNAAHVEVRTRHGARHVVRAGMALLGAPLVGDSVYGGDGSAASFHQLHASRVELLEKGAYPAFAAAVSAPPPEAFLASLARLGLS